MHRETPFRQLSLGRPVLAVLLLVSGGGFVHLAAAQESETNPALVISATPEAEDGAGEDKGPAVLLGAGPMIAPVYDGSKKFQVSPFPLVDVSGLLGGRVFVSSLRGIGVNAIDEGAFKAGISVTYRGGRVSKDDDRLKGLSDLTGGPIVAGFMTYNLRPFAFEVKVENQFGPNPGTTVTAGATYVFSPIDRMRVSIGPQVQWADARWDKYNFGVTPDEARIATAEGNPLRPYSPGAGVKDVAFSATAFYQLGPHWGLAARVGLQELIGGAATDSPLTQQKFQPSIAFGATYKF